MYNIKVTCKCIEHFGYEILNKEMFESTRHLLKNGIEVYLGGQNYENMNWSCLLGEVSNNGFLWPL